ncbi:MAG: 3-phosphoserine/phosphohydroxythreonine transaminase [Erysipelotrichaceae bacterium]|jgi:phosphoserine aminotransferase|nr:3-phosphoserine/phosphohydroxythreonine transaminase [Bacillota bacterium]HCY06800.1 3-phosphoserine/phosphohydroxythreonine aminotransferase [Erysipelotrichaceae bacterium]
MNRVYNFSAGPSCIFEDVLQKAADQMLDYEGSKMSVMEMSHRSKVYESIITECEARLRRLMNIPENYKVLFLQGGASLQFTMIPMNLLKNKKVDVINTGQWTKKAITEHKKLGEVNIIASSQEDTFSYIPKVSKEMISEDSDYVYICQNNTIYGTAYNYVPDTNGKPLIADFSSCILSKPYNVADYDLIFAGAQKNMGPAGLTVVIIKEDLIEEKPELPSMLSYKVHADNGSMFNTPPTYSIYMCGLVLEYLEETIGGLENMQKINEEKAKILYDFIDSSKLFKNPVNKEDRSIMNVTFVTGDEDLDKLFVSEATKNGFVNLKGHRSVGGMRASIYNAMPVEGVKKLVAFMKEFEEKQNV